MVASVETLNTPFARTRTDSGQSADAERLHVILSQLLDSLLPSVTLGGRFRVLAELKLAYEEASEDNWDGYGAQKAQAESLKYAEDFLIALPTTIPLPEAAIDPDGEMSFTWQLAPRLVFSVSVSSDGVLSYAGLFGRNKTHGTEDFVQAIPKAISDNLERLFSTRG